MLHNLRLLFRVFYISNSQVVMENNKPKYKWLWECFGKMKIFRGPLYQRFPHKEVFALCGILSGIDEDTDNLLYSIPVLAISTAKSMSLIFVFFNTFKFSFTAAKIQPEMVKYEKV